MIVVLNLEALCVYTAQQILNSRVVESHRSLGAGGTKYNVHPWSRRGVTVR